MSRLVRRGHTWLQPLTVLSSPPTQVEKSRARLSQRLVEEQRANGFLREVAEAREDEATQAAELLLEVSSWRVLSVRALN